MTADRTKNLRGRTAVLPVLIGAVLLAIVAAACTSAADSTADATTAAPATTIAAGGQTGFDDVEEPADETPGDVADRGSGGIAPTPLPVDFNRDIIFTADLQIAVNDVAAAGAEATQKIEALGGFLFGQQSVGGNEPRSILVFKIIPERFQTALEQLGSIGELRNQTIAADDVTERVVNLESQIATNQASVERLRELLQGAGTVEELAQLEAQLLARETALEQLRGTLRTLQDQVALATITVRIEEARVRPGIEVVATAYPGFEDSGTSCPGSSVQLTVDRGTAATVCWEIRNIGDTDLTDFQLTDTVLDLTLEDLLVIDGAPEQQLRPGQSILLAVGVDVDRRLRSQTRVAATPVTVDGIVLEDRQVASTTSVTLQAEDPGGIPSFGEGVSRSWRALVGLFQVVVLAAGLAIPFLWVPLVVFVALAWIRRRRDATPDAVAEQSTPAAQSTSSGDRDG